jgi:hypothetical protein
MTFDMATIFTDFLKKNCPQDHILKNSYPHIHFNTDTLYLEFTPQFQKIHHQYYQSSPESVSFDMTNELERIYGDLLFSLDLKSEYDEFVKKIKMLSDKLSHHYLDSWEDVDFDGNNEAHYLYAIPIWQPIEAVFTDEMKEKAQEALKQYSV